MQYLKYMCVCSVMSNSCNPMDCIPPGSSVQGISQARILEWVDTAPEDLPHPGIEPVSPALAGGFFTHGAPWEAYLGYIILYLW